MRAGKLKHVIYADEPVATQTDAGEEDIDFQEAFYMLGSIEPIAGREALRAGEILAEADTKINVRWSPNVALITEKWRLRHDTTIFNIKRVAHIEFRRREVEIWASSGLNEG